MLLKLCKHLGQGLSWLKPIKRAHSGYFPSTGMIGSYKYYVDLSLLFGLRSSPFKFNKLSIAIAWIFLFKCLISYVDFILDNFGGKLSTRLYDKRDDFDFHIVNFPFLSSNIPSGPSYGVYISQLIRYARCCSHYEDFRYHHKCLVDQLLSQGYRALRLKTSCKKFYGRCQDLIDKYQRSVNLMVNDSFPG